MDNYYNSVKLTEKLLDQGIFVCGTLRANRGTSLEFEKNIAVLKKDQICYEVNDKYIVGGYHDRRLVRFISSVHIAKNTEHMKLWKKTCQKNGEKKYCSKEKPLKYLLH